MFIIKIQKLNIFIDLMQGRVKLCMNSKWVLFCQFLKEKQRLPQQVTSAGEGNTRVAGAVPRWIKQHATHMAAPFLGRYFDAATYRIPVSAVPFLLFQSLQFLSYSFKSPK